MFRKTKYSVLAAAAGLSALGGVALAGAVGPNLIQNPTFDSSITHWQLGPNTPWTAIGWSEGTMKVTNNAPWDLRTYGFAAQCVPVEAGNEYKFTAESFLPGGQEREGGAQLMIVFHQGDDCDGGQLTVHETGTAAWADNWSSLSVTGKAPATANSAWAYLSATKNKPWVGQDLEAPLAVFFDNVWFGLAETGPDERPVGEPETPGLDEPENPTPPDEPQVEDEPARPGDEPQDEPGDEPQDEPGDEPQDEPDHEPQDEPGDDPQDEPGDEPQDEPGDEPQDEPGDDQPQDEPVDEPQDDDSPVTLDDPLPPDTGDGFALNDPDLTLALGVGLAGAALFAVGAATVPVRRRN